MNTQPIFTSTDWIDGDDYTYAYAETSDPRIVAVIKTDTDASFSVNLEGDAIFPTFMVERGEVSHVGGYDGDTASIASRIVEARDQFRYAAGYRYNGLSADMIAKGDAMTARYARIFHDTVFHRGNYGDHGCYDVIVLSTPEYREHITDGEFAPVRTQTMAEIFQAEQESVTAFMSEVEAIADGYVYGIGYATNMDRLSHDEPVEYFMFDEEIESWGYIGEDYAKSQAASFEYGRPTLPELMAGTEPLAVAS